LLTILLLLVAGCSSDGRTPPPPPASSAEATKADPTPVPDFHSYVLGELPAPNAVERDPFVDRTEPDPPPAPGVRTARPVPAPSLRGIVRSEGRLVALFDGGSAGVDDTVGGWRVTAIDARSVTLERGRRIVRRTL